MQHGRQDRSKCSKDCSGAGLKGLKPDHEAGKKPAFCPWATQSLPWMDDCFVQLLMGPT